VWDDGTSSDDEPLVEEGSTLGGPGARDYDERHAAPRARAARRPTKRPR
jgi:hypothetical protein